MERTEETPPPPLSAEHDADCSKKADDTSETEEEELNKDGDESLHKNQGGQTSVSEKQMTADEKCSEEVVQVISLPPKSPPIFHVSTSKREYRRECLPSPSPQHQKEHRAVFQGSSAGEKQKEQAIQNILPYSYRFFPPFSSPTSNWNTVQSLYIPPHERLPPYFPPPYFPFNDTPPTSSPESIVNTHSVNRYGEPITPAFQSAKCIPNMTADTDSDWRKETVTRASSSFDYPDEFIFRESEKRFPSTAADPTPGHSQDNTRGTALYATAGPSTLPLSTKEDQDSDSAAFYDRKKGVELSGSTVGVHYKPPRTKNSAQDLEGSSTREKQTEQATHNIVPYPGLLDVSPLYPHTSNWKVGGPWTKNSAQDLQGSSTGEKQKEQATPNILPYPGLLDVSPLYRRYGETFTPAESCSDMPVQSAKCIPNVTADSDSDCDTKHKISFGRKKKSILDINELIRRKSRLINYVTEGYARPGQSMDNTRETASPGKPLHETSGRGYFLPGSSSTGGNYSTENPLFVDPRLQQPSSPYFAAMVKYFPSYSTSSRSVIPIAKKRALTRAENISVMPLDLSMKRIPKMTADTDSADSDCDTSERSKMKSAVKHERKSKIHSSRRKKKSKKSSPGVASTVDSSDYTLDQPPPGPLRETVMKTPSTAADATPGHSHDNTRETELHATAGPSSLQHFMDLDDSLSDSQKLFDLIRDQDCNSRSCSPAFYTESGENRSEIMSVQSENNAQMKMETIDGENYLVPNTWPTEGGGPFNLQLPDIRLQSPAELSDFDLESELLDDLFSSYSSTVHTAGSGENINLQLLSVPSECEAGGDADALVILEAPVTAVSSSATNTQQTRPHRQLSSDPGRSQRGSSCLPRSHSVPSLSQISSAENKTFRPSESLPDMLLKSSFEEFTPVITVDENNETYRFLCSCPGLYQCSVTGLVFHMEGEGDVVYRIVSWDRRLLAQHHKKPAGPLFDIKCRQQSVCRLHLPHCEIRSTAGCEFLSVAHVNDESVEFISPHKITETHVIINITGFSGFGNVKDEDSPPEPVRALVLLFYRPLSDQNLTSFLNVLMLPRNVVVRDVQRTRKKLVGDELYIETSSHCKLLPEQEYTLSTCPEDDSVLVQPKDAEFDEESYDNYIPSFQVTLKTVILNMKTLLRDTNSSHIVWEREVCLPPAGLKGPCVQGSSDQRLFDVRSSFIEGISGPVLKSLLDKLFEKKVLTDSERESADEMQNKRDKASFVIDTVRRKGEAASSEMIEFLCKDDPFLCKHLGLIVT